VRDDKRITVAWVAIAVIAAWWFFLGSASVSTDAQLGRTSPAVLALLGTLAAANLGLLILAAITVRLRGRLARIFVVVVLVANIVAAFLDQVGALDIAYAVAVFIALGAAAWSWRTAPE
jgi:hypothetical protein